MNPTCHSITTLNIDTPAYFNKDSEWVLFDIEHEGLQTQLILSKLPDYVLVFLEENGADWKVGGATYCINKHEGAFGILTPFKKILFIPYDAKIDINSLTHVSLDKTTETKIEIENPFTQDEMANDSSLKKSNYIVNRTLNGRT